MSPSLMSLKFSIVIPHSYPCAKRIITQFLPFDLIRLYLTLGITVKASVRVYGMDYDMDLRSLITQKYRFGYLAEISYIRLYSRILRNKKPTRYYTG